MFLLVRTVVARKLITKATQFGPLEGVYLSMTDSVKLEDNKLDLRVENDCGKTYRLDISDESM